MTALELTPVVPADEVFSHALRGEPCFLLGAGAEPIPLPIDDWARRPDAADLALLDLCEGATIDVGCGPGRLTAELTARGQVALGIDIVHEAVAQTVRRGAAALRRDVFGPLPGDGRWRTVLLADGNIGIGGDPVALLGRTRRLLGGGGRVVVEVAGPGSPSGSITARLACACSISEPFPWAIVGLDRIAALAASAGLRPTARRRLHDRWAVVLEELR